MKSVMVLGGMGNMGRRYCAVLRHLGIKAVPIDVADGSMAKMESSLLGVQGIIIATPTGSHANDIADLSPFGLPLLCEKPISTKMARVISSLAIAKHTQTPLSMVNQYCMLTDPNDVGDSYYDYWNHGRDGLAWDCISVIALARGKITLGEESPKWMCAINGRQLSSAMMDQAYIEMIRDWCKNPLPAYEYIELAHNKVQEFARKNEQSAATGQGVDRHPSAQHEQPATQQGYGHYRRDDDDTACPRPSSRERQLP